MKNLLLIIGLGTLQGCTLLDAYLMTKYDPNEYRLISEIRTDSMIAKRECKDTEKTVLNARNLANKTQLFEIYSENIPRNENLIVASKSLNQIAQGLAINIKPSEIFCKIKFETIETNAIKMQHIIGARPR